MISSKTQPIAKPESPIVSVIIPTLNEAQNIPILLTKLTALLSQNISENIEIIIVDDQSSDGTPQIVEDYLQEDARLKLISRSQKADLARSILCGFENSSAEIVCVMDADLSHPPELIVELIRQVLANPQTIAFGSRYTEGGRIGEWPSIRSHISKAGTILARRFCNIADPLSGCFALSKTTLKNIKIDPHSWKVGLEIACKTDAPIIEIPYTFSNRIHGKSKLRFSICYNFLRHLACLLRTQKTR